jgi:hypothetical protein
MARAPSIKHLYRRPPLPVTPGDMDVVRAVYGRLPTTLGGIPVLFTLNADGATWPVEFMRGTDGLWGLVQGQLVLAPLADQWSNE